MIETLTGGNWMMGNLILGVAAYQYGGARGFIAYAVTTGITNLGAIREGNYREFL